METQSISLTQRIATLKAEAPKLRTRNIADELGVSEVEVLATNVGANVIRLRPDFEAILRRVEALGYVMALTRNDDVVHERKGVYQNGSFGPHASMFLGEDIDLRIFLKQWDSAFSVQEDKRLSLQFFAKDGMAMHKIYLTPQSKVEEFNAITNDFKHEDQTTSQTVTIEQIETVKHPDEEIDIAGFQEAWKGLKDTHEFFGLLRKYKVSRTQALRLAPSEEYAVRVSANAVRTALEQASETQTPIMVFVGNKGMIQIHTGPVNKLLDHGQWFNVLDPAFNLHLKEPSIDEVWVVRKPTTEGMVTSVEVFNHKKELIVTLFGKRKPGIPELDAWRAIAEKVTTTCVY